jgi:hypothetical protein
VTVAAPVLHRGVGQPTACRSCGTRIVFARSSSTGKLMPFEADAVGEWVLTNGAAEHVGKAPAAPVECVAPIPRWTSHFARCKHAEQWRRSR